MSNKSELSKILAENWQFVVFVVTGILAWWGGKKQQEFKIQNLSKDLEEMRSEMKDFRAELTKRDGDDHAENLTSAKAISKLCADVKNNSDTLERIERRLDGKVDK